MSETAKQLFEGMKSAKEGLMQVAPGLKNLVPDLVAEGKRLGTQGAMESASLLFHGDAFVPYGPGQYTPTPEHGNEQGHGQEQEHGNVWGHER